MSDTISVTFPLKTSSAKSFDDLLRKADVTSSGEFVGTALGFYSRIVKQFNNGCDIFEINATKTNYALVDLFAESANAPAVAQLRVELNPSITGLMKIDFSSDNFAAIMMNAYYFYDRVIDTEARGCRIATYDSTTRQLTAYHLDIGS